MPELPEVETVRRDIASRVVGDQVQKCWVTGARTVRRTSALEVERRTAAWRVDRVERHGKYLMLCDDRESDVWFVHLRMSGRFEWVPAGTVSALAAHTHVRWRFVSGGELRFVDPRTFGEVFVAAPEPVLSRLGPDPVAGRLGARQVAQIAAAMRDSARVVADVLVDQRVIAGVGNIYCSEACFVAGVDPLRRATSLSTVEAHALVRAASSVLRDAVKYRGTTLADLQYRGVDGTVGRYQQRLRAYGRAGAPCRRCDGSVERVRHGGRSLYRCVACQS